MVSRLLSLLACQPEHRIVAGPLVKAEALVNSLAETLAEPHANTLRDIVLEVKAKA